VIIILRIFLDVEIEWRGRPLHLYPLNV